MMPLASPLKLNRSTQQKVECGVRWLLWGASATSVLVTLAIIFSVLFEALRFFSIVPVTHFLFGLQWSPQMALRADQA